MGAGELFEARRRFSSVSRGTQAEEGPGVPFRCPVLTDVPRVCVGSTYSSRRHGTFSWTCSASRILDEGPRQHYDAISAISDKRNRTITDRSNHTCSVTDSILDLVK